MSRLFVYYSETGNGDYVASIMQSKGFELMKIKPVKPLPESFFLKTLVGGFAAMIGEKAPVENNLSVLRSYDEVYVGTPVWNHRISTPINTVIEALDQKKFSIICYSGSGKAKRIAKQLNNKRVENIISLVEPLKNKEDTINILNKYV